MTLMDRPRAVLRHLFRNLLRRERVERELSQELDDYLAMLVEEKVAAGMSHDAARRAARLEFGGRDQVSERVRDVRIGTWLVNLIQDVRYGIRMSRRRPGFTTAAVLTLTLGIGATVTIFSLLDTVLLRPLPVENPDELANIYTSCRRGNPYCATSFLEFKDYQSQTRTFTDLASFQPMTVSASAESGSWLVTDNYFTLLGLPPFAGQLLTPDMRADADPVVILSHDLWTSRFNGSPEIIGDSLQINAVAFRVIGVTSPGFHGTRAGSRPELWLPIESRSVWARARADTDPLASRGMRWISGTIGPGRKRPGPRRVHRRHVPYKEQRASPLVFPTQHDVASQRFPVEVRVEVQLRWRELERTGLRQPLDVGVVSDRNKRLKLNLEGQVTRNGVCRSQCDVDDVST